MTQLEIVPIAFRAACAFVAAHHRHHVPPRGHKLSLGLERGGELVGVLVMGRPAARHFDDGRTVEVTRSCVVDGVPNGNSKLYGAAWRVARAMGYRRLVTYTQEGETGASLRAAGLTVTATLEPRAGWDTPGHRERPGHGVDGVRRYRWEVAA